MHASSIRRFLSKIGLTLWQQMTYVLAQVGLDVDELLTGLLHYRKAGVCQRDMI